MNVWSTYTARRASAVTLATLLLSGVAIATTPVQPTTGHTIADPLAGPHPAPRTGTALPGTTVAEWGQRTGVAFTPYESAPACPTHNNRVFHTLWNPVDGCHYDHHHGDNPHELDSLFGTSLYSLMGGEISHPWQTFSDAGPENTLKHAGYFWHVRRDLQPAPGQAGYIKAFRLLVHQHPSGRDAEVRFHSGVFEGLVVDTATGAEGYIQIPGMWIDFGHLLIDGRRVLDVGMEAEPGRHKQHVSSGTPQIIWYGASRATETPDRRGRIPRGFVSISTSVHDTWDYTSPSNPSGFDDLVCFGNPRCQANATLLRPHLIGVQIPRVTLPFVDADGDGIANWTGYTDRYGAPVTGCAAASLDCVPVTLRNIRTSVETYSCDQQCEGSYRDYDIYFNGRTSGWSQPVP